MTPSREVHPVRVMVAKGRTEADLAIAFLEDKGIHAQVENAATHDVLDGVADILDQGLWVVVASDRAADARRAVAEFRAHEPLEEDASLPDDGEE